MGKWLALGGIALLVILLLLWRQMQPSEPAPAARKAAPAGGGTQVAMAGTKPGPAKPTAAVAEPTEPSAPSEPATPVQPGKLDPKSDEFFYKFDSVVPKQLTRDAARCYEGRHGTLHRNQKLSLRFKTKIVKGEVTIHDVTIKESTLNDSALETCFIQAVQRATWHDDELPDWEQDDELVLRPQRGMKKYWRENLDAE